MYNKEWERDYYKKNRVEILAKKYKYSKKRDSGLWLRFLSMKARCNHKSNSRYKDYGARGIKLQWSSYKDFRKDMLESFLEHLKNHSGWNTTIERINVEGNYCKENCIWVSRKQQAKNKRNTAYVNYEGSRQRLKDLYKSSCPVCYQSFMHRVLRLGWSIEKALTKPRIK